MPKYQYKEINFRPESLRLIDIINSVIEEYTAQGYDLTLRQVYYQLVARDYIPNNERSYKNIGNLINDARMAGLIDWLAIQDRTRNIRRKDVTDLVVLAERGQSLNCVPHIRQGLFVRRLTPLECERLQGYPDGWTDIGDWTKTDKKGKSRMVSSADSLRYKALGNSIALPPWAYVLTRLSLCAAEEPTMASLFDGIGGFPLIWEWLNGKGTCLWASEIEDFPIAVTKEHFPDEDDNLIPLF